jgi:PIN domain nuclease of toxin-antitoxin system
LRAIQSADALGVCAISCWEVAMLVVKGRLQLDRDVSSWVHHALTLPQFQLLPLSPEVAVEAALLGEPFPGDPADRFICATASLLGCNVVTKDARLRAWQHVRSIW